MAYDEYPDERGLRYPVAFVYSVVIAAICIPALAIRRVARFLLELCTESWPQVSGSITAGNVTVIHGWIVDYALARLDYSYQIHGEYYAGCVIRQFPDEQVAWDFVNPRRGRPVTVRYEGDRADKSVLRDEDQDRFWTYAGPALSAMIWQHWRDEARREPPIANADAAVDDEDDASDIEEDLEGEGTNLSNPR